MIEVLLRLIILFAVIIDPLLTLAFFVSSTQKMSKEEKIETTIKSIILAFSIVLAFLFFGEMLLKLFSIDLNHFRIAGGIILALLGIKMTLGLTFKTTMEDATTKEAISALIATPLISGPACITTIIVSSFDYGRLVTGIAVSTVILITAGFLFLFSIMHGKKIPEVAIKMTTTMMGLITVAWGISFIMTGLGL
ncbi:MAG: MarC family protein [Candidatus Woesearchaeota archaeon]